MAINYEHVISYMIEQGTLPQGIVVYPIKPTTTYATLTIEGAAKPPEQDFIDAWAIIESDILAEDAAETSIQQLQTNRDFYLTLAPMVEQLDTEYRQSMLANETTAQAYTRYKTLYDNTSVARRETIRRHGVQMGIDTDLVVATDVQRGQFNSVIFSFMSWALPRVS